MEYAWNHVFYPDRNDLPGFFEHAGRGRWNVVVAAWRTWVWALWPLGFYRRVSVEHRIVYGRLAVWLVYVIMPLHVVASLLSTIRIGAFPGTGILGRGAALDLLTYLSCWTYPLATVEYNTGALSFPLRLEWQLGGTPLYIPAALVMHSAFAAICLALPSTLGAAKVRRGHIARAFVYGLAWLPLLAVFRIGRNGYLLVELLENANLGMIGFGWGGPAPVRLARFYPEVSAGLIFVWVAFWWWAVFVRGWRVRQAGLVWAMLGIAAGVAAMATWLWLDLLGM